MEVPVLVLDVTEAEADKLLLTYDPISAMATADAERLDALIKSVSFETDAIDKMLDDLSQVTRDAQYLDTSKGGSLAAEFMLPRLVF